MKSTTSNFIFGLLLGALACCLGFSMIGRGQKSGGSGVKEVELAHGLPEDHPVHKGIVEFGRELSVLSGGSMEVKIYAAATAGTEEVCLEKAQRGELDITKVSCAKVGNFVPVFKLFSLPYLFRDGEHYWNVLDGEVGLSLLKELESNAEKKKSGLVGLTYYDAGARSFYAKKPLRSAADLRGLKIRVQADPVSEKMVKALGASAVAIPFAELYTSLKQGGVDGAENNAPSFHSTSHYEVCKHYLLDKHSRIPDLLVMGSKFWEGLNETEQGWVQEAAQRSSQFQRALWAEETAKLLATLKEEGVTIREADIAEFQRLTSSVMDEFATGERLDYVNQIQAVK
ncbi:MAG: TRAP transporter substrate-binding protein [Roseibacillus sp.]